MKAFVFTTDALFALLFTAMMSANIYAVVSVQNDENSRARTSGDIAFLLEKNGFNETLAREAFAATSACGSATLYTQSGEAEAAVLMCECEKGASVAYRSLVSEPGYELMLLKVVSCPR